MIQLMQLISFFPPTALYTLIVSLFSAVLLMKYLAYKKPMEGLAQIKSSKKFLHTRNLALVILRKPEALKSIISSYAEQFQRKGYFSGVLFLGRFIAIGRYDRVEELVRDTQVLDKSFAFDFIIPFVGEGVIVSKGDKWKERRRFVRQVFMGSSLAKSNESIYRVTDGIVAKISKNQNVILDLRGFFSNHTMRMILDKTLGVDLSDENITFIYQAIEIFMMDGMRRILIPFLYCDAIYKIYLKISGLQSKIDLFNNILKEAIRRKLKQMKDEAIKKEGTDDGDHLSSYSNLSEFFLQNNHSNLDDSISPALEEAMLEEIKAIIGAGSEGPNNVLTWFVYILGLYPDIQDKIHDEIGDTDPSEWTLKTVNGWKYLDQCFKESIRLFMAVPFLSRATEKDENFDGHVVPKGTLIIVMLYNVLRDETIFPESDQFKPDRFHPDAVPKIPPGAFIPFGVRPRDCIGQLLAPFYIKFAVAQIVRQFRVESKKHFNDVHAHFNFTLNPSEALFVKFTKRSE